MTKETYRSVGWCRSGKNVYVEESVSCAGDPFDQLFGGVDLCINIGEWMWIRTAKHSIILRKSLYEPSRSAPCAHCIQECWQFRREGLHYMDRIIEKCTQRTQAHEKSKTHNSWTKMTST